MASVAINSARSGGARVHSDGTRSAQGTNSARGISTTKRAIFLGVVAASLVACGGSHTTVDHHRSSLLLLKELRGSVARSQRASRTQLRVLMGTSRTLVRSILGNPYVCRRASLEPVEECTGEGDWVYGAGSASARQQAGRAVLRLRFDDVGRVSGAEWRH